MPDNAAQDRRAGDGRSLPAPAYSFVERPRAEIPVEGKWPRAWRLLFLVTGAAAMWLAVVAIIRWL
jgi:hypothetical protein